MLIVCIKNSASANHVHVTLRVQHQLISLGAEGAPGMMLERLALRQGPVQRALVRHQFAVVTVLMMLLLLLRVVYD